MDAGVLFPYVRHRVHIDLDRPPLIPKEVAEVSQLIGQLKRAKRSISNCEVSLRKYEDKSVKKSQSGELINAGLNMLTEILNSLGTAIDIIESGRNYGREGK